MTRKFLVTCGLLTVAALAASEVSASPARMPSGTRSYVAAFDQGQEPPRAPRGGAPVRGGRRGGPPPAAGNQSPEALFEGYVRRQARAALQLTPEEMRIVEPRLQQLQVTRRRLLRERQRYLNELAAATRAGGPGDPALVRERLEAFEAFKVRADRELQTAQEALDQVLSVEQRARFRVFERRMERQRLELLTRARREAQASAAEGPAEP